MSGQGTITTCKGTIRAGEGTIRAGFLMLPHPLTNFEIQQYYQNEPKFNDIYSRNNLPKIKEGTYVINLDEYKSIGTYWIALYANAENLTYFDSFGLDIFKKKFENSLEIKILQRIFIEYRHMIWHCVNTFVLDFLILC